MPQQRQNRLKDFTTCFDCDSHSFGCIFHDDAALELALALRDKDMLESIKLDVESLIRDSEGVKELGKSLSQLPNLKSVTCDHGISQPSETDERVADLLLGYLGENENVTELTLVSVVLAEGFVKFLRSNRRRPLTLKLDGCPESSQVLKATVSAFCNSNIKSLHIATTQLSGRELGRRMLENCRHLHSLHELIVGDRDASDPRDPLLIPKELFDNLGLSRLKIINITDASFSTDAIYACAHYLRTNTQLKELSFKNCIFRSEESLRMLFSAIYTSQGSITRLRKLGLDFYSVPLASRIPVLARDLLLNNQTIESLRLGADLGNDSLLPIADGINGNDSLKELDLTRNFRLSSVGHLIPVLRHRPQPMGLIVLRTGLRLEGFNEISEALENQVPLQRLECDLGDRIECATRFFRSLSINEHLVDLSLCVLNLEEVGMLADTMGSFAALENLSFGWPTRSGHSKKTKAVLRSRFLVAMGQNTTFLSVRIRNSPFNAGDIELYTLRNLLYRYGRHEVAVKAGWPTGISSHLFCRFLPKECPHAGQLWAMTYLKEISAGVGHPKQRAGGKRDRGSEDKGNDVLSAGNESVN